VILKEIYTDSKGDIVGISRVFIGIVKESHKDIWYILYSFWRDLTIGIYRGFKGIYSDLIGIDL